jgi:hypothetical protein
MQEELFLLLRDQVIKAFEVCARSTSFESPARLDRRRAFELPKVDPEFVRARLECCRTRTVRTVARGPKQDRT